MKQISALALVAFILLAAACRQEVLDSLDPKTEYFPVQNNHTLYYEVDSFLFNPLYTEGRDTAHWQLKEVYTQSFTDNVGREVFKVEQYMRQHSGAGWQFNQIIHVVKEEHKVEYNEQNLRFVPLTFPAALGRTWDGNSLIVGSDTFEYYRDWKYEIIEIDAPQTINNLNFDSTLTVLEVEDENLLEKRFSKSIYAKHVGLVEKEQHNLEIVNSTIPDPSIPWEEKANRGYIFIKRITGME